MILMVGTVTGPGHNSGHPTYQNHLFETSDWVDGDMRWGGDTWHGGRYQHQYPGDMGEELVYEQWPRQRHERYMMPHTRVSTSCCFVCVNLFLDEFI